MGAPANDRLLRALHRQPVDRVPVWIMRQAGRYLPEYRALRERAGSFLNLCRTPEYACEAALQPLQRYPLDAAIVFSDILTIPDAMGLGLEFIEGAGPRFARPLRSAADIQRLAVPDPQQDLGYVCEAVRLLVGEVGANIPVIGFAGSPWTLATYMIEGESRSDFTRVRALLHDEPEQLDALLDVLSEAVLIYLQAQIDAGADVVMIFDSWGGVLEDSDYVRFSLRPTQHIVQSLSGPTPCILYARGAGQKLAEAAAIGCEALGVDESVRLADARRWTADRCALQGNLDPQALRESEATLRQGVREALHAFGAGPGHIFNLGHGITPDIEPDQVSILINEVHQHRPTT